jgi:hypothetical protein
MYLQHPRISLALSAPKVASRTQTELSKLSLASAVTKQVHHASLQKVLHALMAQNQKADQRDDKTHDNNQGSNQI